MTDQVRKVVISIPAGVTTDCTEIEHDLGPDVIVQVRSDRGRVLKMRVDVLPDRVRVHFKDGTSEKLIVVIIG